MYNRVVEGEFGFGWNAACDEYGDMMDAGIVDPADRPGGLRYGQYEILRVEIPLWLRPTARAFAGGIGCRGRVPTALLKNTCADKLHDREHARPCAATWIKWHPRGQARCVCVARGARARAPRAARANRLPRAPL